MKKILVPCDFSNPAIQAFRFACEIASVSKGEIFLLNVVELPVIHSSLLVPVKAYENAFLKEIKSKANRNFDRLKEKWGKKIKVQFSVEMGSVASTVLKSASKKKADLIVMGTHGSGGLREFAIGSNTEKIVRASKIPVVAVKKNLKVSEVRDVIFPTDLNLTNSKLMDQIKSLQGFLKAKLHILYINTPANFSNDLVTGKKLNEFAKTNRFKNYTVHIFNDVDEESGITDFALRFKNKIVAMPTHSRKGISHLMSGSIAEDIVNHLDCPIWTFGEPK